MPQKIRTVILSRTPALTNIKQDTSGKETLFTLENKVLKITFTNKGGQPKMVELKDFKTFDKKPLILQDGNFSNISYAINSGNNETVQTSDLLFSSPGPQTAGDGKEMISFSLLIKRRTKDRTPIYFKSRWLHGGL